jgi:hypothetical protein
MGSRRRPALLALLLFTAGLTAQSRPDFSGTWTFDQEKSMKPDASGRIVLAAMLGEEFVALQDASALTLRISFQRDLVVAVYDLHGRETENTSPGDITVRSRTTWQGQRLAIESTSEGIEDGKPVTIRTRRVLWIDEDGDLILERTGTPASQVTPSRSIYRRTVR